MEWRVVNSRRREIVAVHTEVRNIGMVRRHVDCVRGDRNWSGKVDLLPAACRFGTESSARQKCPAAAPQVRYVRPRVTGALVKTNSVDRSAAVSFELYA